MVHHFIASADFSKRTLNALTRRNIFVTGIQMIPDMTSAMPWANATKAYCLADNACGIVRSFDEVLQLAKR